MKKFFIFFGIIFIPFLIIDSIYCGSVYGGQSHCLDGPEFLIYSIIIFVAASIFFAILRAIYLNIFKGKPYLSKIENLILIFVLIVVGISFYNINSNYIKTAGKILTNNSYFCDLVKDDFLKNRCKNPFGGAISDECTKALKVCPDGSYVNRIGSSCEFAACPTSTPVATLINENEGWQTYRNEEFWFELQYPPAYSPKEYFNEDYLFLVEFSVEKNPETPMPHITVAVYDSVPDINEWLRQHGLSEGWIKNEDFIVDGQKAIYLTGGFELGSKPIVIMPYKNKIFRIENYATDYLDQMLSTFKFTD